MKKFKNLNCVLLVDDDVPTNYIHRRIVQNTNIEVNVKSITSAQEALDYLTFSGKYEHDDTLRPGIIFLDINMPGMSGWDFMEEYGKIDAAHKARTIVIMLTTSLNPDDELMASENKEIVTYMHKPLNEDAFVKIAGKYFEEINN
ncbi:response regulator [Pedobacter caeni]|uniref:Response regulator receiver domain-containing protein n=1 Tax=Pedobacter caeni TaxID=288992 RepID=A0A1M4SZM8_9SPHI|nr:response regulator [Pedobacter caeni]SHE37654.1 Response regulator receiver domain-containing protein [Pedobacter caeni]